MRLISVLTLIAACAGPPTSSGHKVPADGGSSPPTGGVLRSVDRAVVENAPRGSRHDTPRTTGPCPEEMPFTSSYRTWDYGFSIDIPAGLRLWRGGECVGDENNCLCPSDHGGAIPLTGKRTEPDRQVGVYGEWNSLELVSSSDVVKTHLGYLRAGGRAVHSGPIKPFMLGGLAGSRVVARLGHIGSKDAIVEDDIAVIDHGMVYEVSLRTHEEEYKTDVKILEAVAHSWERVPVEE